MDEAVVLIAESVAKAVGVAGVEAMALRQAILSVWTPLAEKLGDNIERVCFNYETGEVRIENADYVLSSMRVPMSEDFIDQVEPFLGAMVDEAWERGRQYTLEKVIRGVFKHEKNLGAMDGRVKSQTNLDYVGKDVSETIIDQLVTITGSTKENVHRTISRWFRTTQGQYFERFIVPETQRLLSYAQENEGNIATIRSIGVTYKKFVQADGYWSSISEYNTETSKIFSQVQTMQELQIQRYTIEAILDEKTCPVCEFMNGSTWDVSRAVETMYDMLIAEADNAREVNPFPPRSTPKDFENPEDSPYYLPPYHPRCRCNIVTEESISAAPTSLQSIAPSIAVKPPSARLLTGMFNNSVVRTAPQDLSHVVDANLLTSGAVRAMSKAEYGRVREAFQNIPFELRKWAKDNKLTFNLTALTDPKATSRLYGNVLFVNAKYLKKGVGTQVIEHELRHALINKQVISLRGGARGADTLWDSLKTSKFKMPAHVNQMYRLNGGRGVLAASAATDEFLAMMGDYYKSGMSMDDMVAAVRSKKFGIEVEKVLRSGSPAIVNGSLWSASEAKKAVAMWWDWMDVDNYTLMSKKQLMSTLTHKPSTSLVQKIARDNEYRLRDVLTASGVKKVAQLGDNEPFDVWVGGDVAMWYRSGAKKYRPKHVVEIKSIIRAKNDKITMHGESLARKKFEIKKIPGVKEHTVVFDERTGKIYYRRGLGSFRLNTMQEVSEAELQKLFGGKPVLVKAPPKPTALEFTAITNKKQFNEFKAAMEKVKPEHRDYLTWYSWEQYKKKGTKLYLAADGTTGYGIEKDGTLISLFSVEGSSNVRLAIENALANGAKRLECFDGKLPKIYGEFGFETVERYPWNPEFAPKKWDYDKFGTPDFVVMKKGIEGRVELLASPEIKKISDFPIVRTSNITKTKPLDEDVAGVNKSFIIMVKETPTGRPKKYLYKPIDGESWRLKDTLDETDRAVYDSLGTDGFMREYGSMYDPNKPIRKTIEEGGATLAHREALAYEVFKKMDFAMVDMPETKLVYDEVGDLAGVAVKWKEGYDIDKIFSRAKHLSDEETFDIAIFDFLIGNTDRHQGNWLRNEVSERMLLIDHGYAFPAIRGLENGLDEFRCVALRNMYGVHGTDRDLSTALDFAVEDVDGYKVKIVQNLLKLDIDDLGKRYNLSFDEITSMLRRRDELVVALSENVLNDYLLTYARTMDHFGFGSLDDAMMPNTIDLVAYQEWADDAI